MRKRIVPASPGAARQEDKAQDDRDFKGRWIAFGMSLKGRADGYGIDWRGKSLEVWMNEITFADVFAETTEGIENHA